MAFFGSPRPDIRKDRLGYERSWEHDMEKNYVKGPMAHLPSIASLIPPEAASMLASDAALLQLEQETRLICEMQNDLAQQAATSFAEDAFEERWLALPDSKRRELLLEGICRTMMVPDMEERRKWCPDSTLTHLASDRGKTFLKMLKMLLPTDLSKPIMEPRRIPHPLIDKLFSLPPSMTNEPGMKTMLQVYTYSRAYCLTLIIWNTFLAFHGRREEQFAIKPPRGNVAQAEKLMEATAGKWGGGSDVDVKSNVKAHNKARKAYGNSCWTCGKSETIDPNLKLLACSKCRAIGRKIWYCSKACQMQDWKSGKPRPHKQICGKALQAEDLEPPASTTRADEDGDDGDIYGIPEADPSYQRSPALLHQISLLRQNPQIDYVVVRPYPQPDHGLTCANPIGRLMFMMARTRAFRNGDPPAVQLMYEALSGMAEDSGIPRSLVKSQLEREFGLTLTERTRAQ